MGSAIILGYVKLILEDPDFTFQMIPKRHQEGVKSELERRGFDENGKFTNDNGK